VPTRSSFNFQGWYETSSFTGTPITQIQSGTISNKIYWAKWSNTDYLISYVLNDGTLPANVRTSFNATNLPYSLPTPTRSGYTFNGWFENANLTGSAITSVPTNTTTNKTYHAKWTMVTYTITYNLNSGTQALGAPTSFNVTQLPLTLPTPARTGFNFQGWYESSSFTGNPITQIATNTTSNKVYFARWEQSNTTYKISYNLNGGSNPINSITSFNSNQLPIILPVPTHNEGQLFTGWFESSNFVGSPVYQIPLGTKENKTFFARWLFDGNCCNLEYNLNGGLFPSGVIILTRVNAATNYILPIPNKSGHRFAGWFDNDDLTGIAISTYVHNSIQDKEYYAKWEQLKTFPEHGEISLTGGGSSMSSRYYFTITFSNIKIKQMSITFAAINSTGLSNMGGTANLSPPNNSITVEFYRTQVYNWGTPFRIEYLTIIDENNNSTLYYHEELSTALKNFRIYLNN
jgi:uncharacterized repeat protein (TIGR02543 family)